MDYHLDTITLLNYHTHRKVTWTLAGYSLAFRNDKDRIKRNKIHAIPEQCAYQCMTWLALPKKKNKSASIQDEYYKIKQTLNVMVICMHEDNK